MMRKSERVQKIASEGIGAHGAAKNRDEIWEDIHSFAILEMGLEPTISSLGGRRLIH